MVHDRTSGDGRMAGCQRSRKIGVILLAEMLESQEICATCLIAMSPTGVVRLQREMQNFSDLLYHKQGRTEIRGKTTDLWTKYRLREDRNLMDASRRR
jgi:hypothetical protein